MERFLEFYNKLDSKTKLLVRQELCVRLEISEAALYRKLRISQFKKPEIDSIHLYMKSKSWKSKMS